MSLIAKRQFASQDLKWFAGISGDWNPIHLDEVVARRLLPGGIVVPGMFTVLWALNELGEHSNEGIGNIKVQFHRPILLGQPLSLFQEKGTGNGEVRLSVCRGAEEVAVIWIIFGERVISGALSPEVFAQSYPIDHSFEDLKGACGEIIAAGSETELRKVFPRLSSSLGLLPIASLLAFSRLVGMKCPGLHSLFVGLNVKTQPEESRSEIFWEVSRHSVCLAPIRIDVRGGGLTGTLDAFIRPQPVQQPSMDVVASYIEPGIFKEQVAFVIGGSRGLGELTAKIISAGGGDVTISYMQGLEDAKRVRDEINNWGGRCSIERIDVEQPEASIAEILKVPLSHLYYFASPRIHSSKSIPFDSSLYGTFNQIYVLSFVRIMIFLSERLVRGCNVFYPSTEFLDERPREFGEYIAAKAAGEAVCQYFDQNITNVSILAHRLPMLLTDQTKGLIRKEMADPLVELTSVVRKLHDRFVKGQNKK
jgi:hypothetical protein